MRTQLKGGNRATGICLARVPDATERLIRVQARRGGDPVELRVHYEVTRLQECLSYRILAVDDIYSSTSTD